MCEGLWPDYLGCCSAQKSHPGESARLVFVVAKYCILPGSFALLWTTEMKGYPNCHFLRQSHKNFGACGIAWNIWNICGVGAFAGGLLLSSIPETSVFGFTGFALIVFL